MRERIIEGYICQARWPSEEDGRHDGQRLKAQATLTFAFVQRKGELEEGEETLMMDAHRSVSISGHT